MTDHDAASEVAIATFLALPQVDDDELVATLVRLGVEAWLAARLATFLPLAFGRRLLPGARVAAAFNHAGTRWRLDEEALLNTGTYELLGALPRDAGVVAGLVAFVPFRRWWCC